MCCRDYTSLVCYTTLHYPPNCTYDPPPPPATVDGEETFAGSVGQLLQLDPAHGKDWVDNVLLEYELALAVQVSGLLVQQVSLVGS
jgi:hypothetical protein